MKYIFLFLLLSNSFSYSQLNYTDYQSILKSYVSTEGQVNYTTLKTKEKEIDIILSKWADVNPSNLSSKEQLAFYINLYNLSTIKFILTQWPLKSIKEAKGGKAWDIKFISLNKKIISLNDLENNLIRPTFKDPRVHFALNCGAISCPPLSNKAFTGLNLDSSLEALTKKFITNPKSTSISTSKLALSKIFDWYKSDFGNVYSFIGKYTPLSSNSLPISYFEYNWSLNGK
jgi:hypothetical protein